MLKTIKILAFISLLVGSALSAHAQTTVSSDFYISFGANVNSSTAVWGTSERTSGDDTGSTLGDFTFTPVLSPAGRFANQGPFFNGATLSNGSSSTGFLGRGDSFGLTITGAYTGTLGVGETATTTLHITNLVVNAFDSTSHGGDESSVAWAETTVGNIQVSPSSTLQQITFTSANALTASNFNPINWTTAGGFSAAGTTVARSFEINNTPIIPMDGLIIEGYVETTVVPEPSTYAALLAIGALGLALVRRRARAEG